MTKLFWLIALTALLISDAAFAQVPARSTPLTCERDDSTSTVAQPDGSQTPCRTNSRGAVWVDLDSRLDRVNDSITGYTLPSVSVATLSGWTSATSVDATQDIFVSAFSGHVLLHLVQTSTITAGAITFEVSYDGTNWVTIPADAVLDPASTTYAQISLPYTLQASTNKPFLIVSKGWQGLRIKLSTAITGTGTVTPNYSRLGNEPLKTVIALSPTAANFNVTPAANSSVNVNQIGGQTPVTTTTRPLDADRGLVVRQPVACTSHIAISQTTDTQVITGTSGQRIYICGWMLFANAAETVNIISGTGSVCATSPTALVGSTTEGNGVSLAANSGFTNAAGNPFIRTSVDADNLCVTQVGSNRVTGWISYVVAPND